MFLFHLLKAQVFLLFAGPCKVSSWSIPKLSAFPKPSPWPARPGLCSQILLTTEKQSNHDGNKMEKSLSISSLRGFHSMTFRLEPNKRSKSFWPQSAELCGVLGGVNTPCGTGWLLIWFPQKRFDCRPCGTEINETRCEDTQKERFVRPR